MKVSVVKVSVRQPLRDLLKEPTACVLHQVSHVAVEGGREICAEVPYHGCLAGCGACECDANQSCDVLTLFVGLQVMARDLAAVVSQARDLPVSHAASAHTATLSKCASPVVTISDLPPCPVFSV
jgi:hypothetical protein